MYARRSSEWYDVILCKVKPYKCSWCGEVQVIGQRRGEEEASRVVTGRSMQARRSSEWYDVILYKVIPYKCSWCNEAFVNSYGEETVSMQNRFILENY